MFQGTVPNQALKLLATVIKEWDCDKIFVGCSGNFTVERAISKIIDCPIVSNDVTIYSCYIGEYLSGKSVDELRVKADYNGECQFFREYMKDDTSKVATLILATDILGYEGQDNLYSKRMLRGYKEQFPELHKSMCEKLKSLKTNVQEFYKGDVMDMLDMIGDNDGFISFPPFFKGGYEKMWKDISKVFEFTEPKYEEFDPSTSIDKLCNKVKGLSNFFLMTERKIEGMKSFYCGVLQTPRGKDVYFYSKTSKSHFVAQFTKNLNCKPIVRIQEDDEVEWPIFLKELDNHQYYMLRAEYLSSTVNKSDPYKGGPSLALGCFTREGKLFGMFALSNSMMLGSDPRIEQPCIYMITDLAVGPTKVKGLSKLVVMCALSKEVKLMSEKVMNKRVKSIYTNAFSRNPSSMKYRGLLELYNRKELEKDDSGKVKKYSLSYGAPMGQWSLKEGFELWKQKLSKSIRKN